MKLWLKDNVIEMYSINNEEKYVVAKRFIRTLKNKIYKHMTVVSKNVYIDKLNDIVNEYNHTYHTTIKMKPADVVLTLVKRLMIKILDFKVGDQVRISKYKSVLAKGYTPSWSENVFVVKNTVPWTCVTNDLISEEIIEPFYEKNYKKQTNKHLG